MIIYNNFDYSCHFSIFIYLFIGIDVQKLLHIFFYNDSCYSFEYILSEKQVFIHISTCIAICMVSNSHRFLFISCI
jgi:hypothetical protein